MGVYWNTLPNEFVAGDRQFILRNPSLGTPDTVKNAFSSDYWGKLGGESFIYFRPLTVLSHFADLKLYGLHPAGHHFSNMVLHTIVTLTVFQLFLYLCAPHLLIPAIGAGLFALHPIHTHSVSYIMGRTDVLAAIFYLWGFILLMRATEQERPERHPARIAGACLCYLLALFCKEIAITLPLIFLLYRFCWRSDRPSLKDSRLMTSCLSLCAAALLYLMVRSLAVGCIPFEGVISSWYSPWQRVCMVIITCGYYLQKLFFPLRLCFYSNLSVPGSWLDAVQSPFFWTGVLFIVSWAVSLRRAPRMGFAIGWIGITLLPVLNIILLPALAKENFLYIPSIGFCLLLALAVQSLADTVRDNRRWLFGAAVTAAALIGILYSGATLRRNTDYRHPITFLETTLNNLTPVPPHLREDVCFFEGVKNLYITYRNLGILYRKSGRLEEAAQAFENALQFTPSYFSPHYEETVRLSLVSVYENMGRFDETFTLLLQARPDAPRPRSADNRLGVISLRQGKKDRAECCFKRHCREDKTNAPAEYSLELLYRDTTD